MSHVLSAQHLQILNTAPSLPLAARWSVAFAVTVTTWDTRYRTRKQLAKLTDDRLRDIGLDRATASAEAAKPFWKD